MPIDSAGPERNLRRLFLPVIVLSQFLCTSLWFAGNAVLSDLVEDLNFPVSSLGHITSSVQLGFITGALAFATLTISDRFLPSIVFFTSAILASLCNLAIVTNSQTPDTFLSLRFLTGFFLAGIYPVGMKIAADHFKPRLSKALGFLVGALVIGTALPHLIKGLSMHFPWQTVFFVTSGLSFSGGLLILLLIPTGPYRQKSGRIDFTAILTIFRNKEFRVAATGYFGHMWELYTFWAFVPVIIRSYLQLNRASVLHSINTSILAFILIGAGSLSCIASNRLTGKWGGEGAAYRILLGSCCCCLFSPLAFYLPSALFVLFLLFWGLAVIADSPVFSTLVAKSAPAHSSGTALTIVNCIGFSITIVSIEILNLAVERVGGRLIYLLLVPGPLISLLVLRAALRRKKPNSSQHISL